MDSAENLFREYLHLRSRMVVYVAIFLALLGVFALFVLVRSSGQNINRFGLLIEWLAFVSVVPHLFGLRRPPANSEPIVTPPPAEEPANQKAADTDAPVVVDGLTGQPIPEEQPAPEGAAPKPSPTAPEESWEAGIFRYYQKTNNTLLVGNIFAALSAIWFFVAAVLYPETLSFPEEASLRALVSLIGFAWLNMFMLMQILLLANAAIPGGMLAGFFTVDFILGFPGIVFAGMVHIARQWLGRGLGFIFRNGARRVLLSITLPFLLFGLALQIIATFVP